MLSNERNKRYSIVDPTDTVTTFQHWDSEPGNLTMDWAPRHSQTRLILYLNHLSLRTTLSLKWKPTINFNGPMNSKISILPNPPEALPPPPLPHFITATRPRDHPHQLTDQSNNHKLPTNEKKQKHQTQEV